MIKLFTIKSTAVKSSAAVLLLPLFVLLNGRGAQLLITLAALIMHEIAHTVMINALGYSLDSIELQPFGFVARLSTPYENALDELMVAAIGPIASMVLGLITLSITQTSQSNLLYAELFGNISTTLGIMNLLPAYPLDGGRILLSALSIAFNKQRAKRITVVIGIAIAAVFSVASIYLLIKDMSGLPYALVFCLLFLAAIRERKELEIANAKRMAAKQSLFSRGGTLRVQNIAINQNSSISQAARHIEGGKYTVFTVLDDDMNVVRTVSESEIMRKTLDGGTLRFKH